MNHHEVVKCLIDNGANVDLRQVDGTTVLMHASKCGFYKTVKVLLKRG